MHVAGEVQFIVSCARAQLAEQRRLETRPGARRSKNGFFVAERFIYLNDGVIIDTQRRNL